MAGRDAHGANEPRVTHRRGRRGRFTDLTIEQLRALFVATLGRATDSTDRRYLEWKIREATHGRVRVGPPRGRGLDPSEMMTLPWRLPRATVALLDDARARLGMHTRSALLARALTELFERSGEDAAAAALRADTASAEHATRDGAAEERIRTTG